MTSNNYGALPLKSLSTAWDPTLNLIELSYSNYSFA